MTFDFTLNIGHIIQIVLMIGSLAAVWGRFVKVEQKVEMLYNWFIEVMKRNDIDSEQFERRRRR